ncbi:MAG: MFS transporter [Actinophytocola sp.]|uniref:MFS transporter n=1 Tax=Actinophytocola sp. TaxID=1872138 RepID=UPI003C727FE0
MTAPAVTADAVREFRWYWVSQSSGVLGSQVATFLLPTIAIVQFGASGTQVGLLTAAGTVAYPALGLFAGVLADRVRRRPVMVVADLARAAAFAWLPVAAALAWLGFADLLVVAFAVGALGVLFDVAAQSHLPTLLPRPMLAMANARMEATMAVAVLAGPVAGGLLLQVFPGAVAPAVAAVLFLISVLALTRLRSREPAPVRVRDTTALREIREGVVTLLGHPLLRPTTIAGAARSFGNAATGTIALVFAYQVLGLAPGVVGLLLTVSGAAGIVGAWTSTRVVARLGMGRTLVVSCASGAVWMLAPLAMWLPPVPVYLAVGAFAAVWLPMWNATVTTLRQVVTPTDLLGRVHATARTVNFSMMPVGAFLGGAGAGALGALLGQEAGFATVFLICAVPSVAGAVALLRASLGSVSVPAGADHVGGGPGDGEDGDRDREQARERDEQIP